MDDSLLDDTFEIGRRISSALGYANRRKTRVEIAKEVGVTAPTLLKYTKGDLGEFSKTTDLRRLLIEKVEQATGCPPGVFGLSALETGEADQLRKEMVEMKNELRAERAAGQESLEARLSSLETAVRKLK